MLLKDYLLVELHTGKSAPELRDAIEALYAAASAASTAKHYHNVTKVRFSEPEKPARHCDCTICKAVDRLDSLKAKEKS